MATQWDPNSTNYTTQMLLGGPGPAVGGQVTGQGVFTDAQVQQLKDAGITYGDLQSLGVLGPPSTQLSTQAYTSGGQAGVQQPQMQLTPEGRQSLQNAGLLQAMLKLGGGQQKQTGPPPPANAYGQAYPMYAIDAQGNPTGKPVYANPSNQMSLLGAAALQMPAVINPPPSGTPSSVSGVAPTGGALIGSTVPQAAGWNWNNLKPAFGMNDQDVAAFQKQGLNPQQVADKLNSAWNPITENALLQSGQFQPRDLAAFKAQGLTPQQVGTRFGVASGLPAPTGTPGMQGPWADPRFGSVFTQVAQTAPTQVTPLQGATQATATGYSPTATPFAQAPPAPGLQIPQTPFVAAHTNALADAGRALFAHFGGDPNSASPADIANFHSQLTSAIPLAAAPQPTAAKKMASGGVVPGRGNKDTVPALLTPGEYVIPKDQVPAYLKMQSGGVVPGDPDPDPNAPPEARRKTLSAQTSQAQPPAAPGGSSIHPGLTSGLATAAQTYGSSMANLPKNPIGSRSGVDIRNTRLDPDPDLPSLKAAGMMGSGGGGGGMQSALGGVASGLGQAAQAIASSAQPWRMQQSAIPNPPPAPAAPQFTQPPAPQQTQQAVNPYAAYAANQARYPTSPYYS